MRAFGWFLLAIAGTLLLTALLVVPVYAVLHPLQPDWSFSKIASRMWQLSMLAGVAACVVGLGLRSRVDWGYGLPRSRFFRQWGLGLAAGIATMLPMAAAILLLDVRVPGPDVPAWTRVVLSAAASGLAVALVEESFFRGVLYTAVRRDSGPRAAIILTALLYASIHFLARTKIPHAEVDSAAGIRLLAGALRWFGDPASMIDAWLSLFAVGLLLGMVRQWTGGIAACIGLHMGWVSVMRTTVGLTSEHPASQWSWVVSEFDAFTGWMVAAWSAVILLLAYAYRDRFARWRAPGSDPSAVPLRAPGTERYRRGV